VTVFAVAQHTIIATFQLDSFPDRVLLSPDGTRLATHSTQGHGGFEFFDIDKRPEWTLIPRKRDRAHGNHSFDGLNWIPHLNGTLISWKRDGALGHHLLGRFMDHSDLFPVLRIPNDVNVSRFAVESSMFALGTEDGGILIGRAPTSSVQ
jgi:hypothetical protein